MQPSSLDEERYKTLKSMQGNIAYIAQVFKAYWPEPAGGRATSLTDTTFNDQFFARIRWFVVVKEGDKFCLCL
jgi:hypothetical protein